MAYSYSVQARAMRRWGWADVVLIWGHLENVYPTTSSPLENTK